MFCLVKKNCEIFLPNNKAKYVLELNSGETDKIKLTEGNEIILSLNYLKD